ncbi:MAG: hypothetical protein AAFW75_04270 [Cyanobacteria bacterium J06636_16]
MADTKLLKATNYSEDLIAISTDPDQQVLLFRRLGLSDDSVRGIRYRLAFVPQGNQWELIWAGTQVTCWPGRGHRNWSTKLCT